MLHAYGEQWLAQALALLVCIGLAGHISAHEFPTPFLELEIERVPPAFTFDDESVVILMTVVAGLDGPLIQGQVTWARAFLDGLPIAEEEDGTHTLFPFPPLPTPFMEAQVWR